MNIYLVNQKEVEGYDTYDSMVVIAHTPEEAIRMDPGKQFYEWSDVHGCWLFLYSDGRKEPDRSRTCWANELCNIDCLLLGVAEPGNTEPRVVLASFNAG